MCSVLVVHKTKAEKELDKLFELAILSRSVTGVDGYIYVSQDVGKRHRPSVKVRLERGGEQVAVSIDEPIEQLAGTPLDAKTMRDVTEFIRLNRDELLSYWNLDNYATDELITALKPIRQLRG